VGPLLRWRRDGIGRVRKELILLAIIALAVLVSAAIGAGMKLLPTLGLALAAAVAAAAFLPLRGRSLRRLPLNLWGMALAHFGIAVALFGMSVDSSFTSEKLVAARVGETIDVGGWKVTLASVEPVAGPNWTALEGRLQVSHNGSAIDTIVPQSRTFWDPPQTTSESALLTRWNGQLYAVIGEQVEGGRWQLRLWWKPFVTCIWLGGVLIGFGGLLALLGRLSADLKRRHVRARGAARRAEAVR
jgi:cytochrome c-type biogenesis protein CcmF